MKFFRVAKEGVTADARQIKGEHLEQMAKNYDPKKYSARVWIEHIRTIMPDGTFKAYGDVLELKTEKDPDGKTVLLAKIDPTDDLKKLNKERQKLFSSVEIDTSFADTGEAYLVGLAVTDSPASLGTERLMFSVATKEPNHLFSQYNECTLPSDDNLFDQLKGFFNKFSQDQATAKAEDKVELSKGFEMVVEHFNTKLGEQATKFNTALAEKDNQINTLKSELDELKGKFKVIDDTPKTTNPRPPATGETHFKQTDC